MTRYTLLLKLGELQAWLAHTWRNADGAWTRAWTLALWVPARACFCFGYWLLVPDEAS